MKWFAVDTRLLTHAKMRKAMAQNRGALEMWLAMRGYVAEHETDGSVPDTCIEILGGAPRDRRRALVALVDHGLIEEASPGEWRFHDFDDHAKEAGAVRARREADRLRKQRSRGRSRGQSADSPQDVRTDSARIPLGFRGLDVDREEEIPEREDPKDLSGLPRARLAEISSSRKCEKSFEEQPGTRADVLEVFAAWRLAVQLPLAKFRGPFDLDAKRIAEAIDAHGLEACLLVAQHCWSDGKVNGKLDERGEPHKSVRYIFENVETFNRIHHAAQERVGKLGHQRSAAEIYREATGQ